MALIEGVEVEHRGSGPDLVILHSLLADRSAFDRVAPVLAKKHRMWLVNLPGYGASKPAGTSVEDYADRVAALLQSLKLENADVLGNGLGGFIAVALAARHGARVRRLIAAPALAAFPEPAKQPLRGLAERVAKEGMSGALDVAIRRMFPERFIAAHPSVVEERKQALMKADPACFRTACLALAALDLSPVLKNIRNEALVMAGSEDATTPPALARELATKIPNARFRELQGCGHCPQIESPELFVQAVEAFLS
ncbi:MAG TPA: alpha/beta fold hydrolase [Burkholderiales bacterium]|jgi:3-oxoadipate enol-lactonase|nr:alpha/beta fold hydrolase [Burkholderiales bacterium]